MSVITAKRIAELRTYAREKRIGERCALFDPPELLALLDLAERGLACLCLKPAEES